MATAARVAGVGALVVVLAAGGYATADAYDVVPGIVTLAPPVPDPAPFPTAPGAVEPGAAPRALGDLDPQVPLPASGQLQALVDGLAADPRLGPGVGVAVVDQVTGELLAGNAPDAGRVPASTAKILTGVAALTVLDPEATLATRVVRIDGGTIAIVGGGDMMLAAGAGDPGAVLGRAGLADLAARTASALALQGTTSVRLLVDDSLFTGPTTSPGWDPANVGEGFVAPVTSLGVDVGRLREGEYAPRSTDPSMQAAAVFAQRLGELGVTVDGSPSRTASVGDAPELARVESAPLVDVVHYFLETSDNTVTEVVSRLVALDGGLPASFDGGTQAVLRQVAQLGVDVSGARLADASGLADGSSLSPSLLAEIVRLTTDPAHPELRDVALGMPVAGLSGTLADRYTRSDARGVVRAKTGSLPHVTSLAGTVLDAQRRQLVFAVMADQTPDGGQWAPRQAIDGFVTALAACGCR
ncbi:D-alanyl-D-alanine carboxypeptidase/D-alanyl-D-alanine endopeptidase [Cellulomonas wangsupingiae]|uniref:D-alanyl-D-alanine carboxypeptidase/D-alanyl-D-alanine-endopeptidase n=1 Tax=Cellulomonas wangsupingiae TaxID=2968085 RepID=A0ABY5K5L8_9CELL|nr:D-alanyl-D-alanine carboxypeptidase/D-alanyl-D-alanine-endopeptidase [Cellulomonas wangsupingiae]MCC2336503.1 D-alanyl-D-alanine carboxypeptidase/D-alanyl-D-alanine-endopeptidase [Cellulomonas wangsupingiae]UUI65749.1 D-alanyl-D-alanine carboxypeptidase/D-alanyl-D-alanine-endopeptidase [Cellulomonas wangsupingiae]